MRHKIVLVDDEPLGIEVLKYYIKEEVDFEITGAFTNPHQALAFINVNKVDLLLLDIEMPTLSGIELLQQITCKPLIIFTTAYKEYLQSGFDYGILDYLQKPIKKERLGVALTRARDFLQKRVYNKVDCAKLYLKSGNKEYTVVIDDILFIKSAKDYCIFYLVHDKTILVKTSMDALLKKIQYKSTFIRVHKSFVIALDRIDFIKNNKEIAIAQYNIPIGRMFKKAFYSQLENYKC